MRKLTIATVAVAAMVFPVHAAEAAPPGCQVAYDSYNQSRQAGFGLSQCADGVQRLVLSCINTFSLVTYVRYGPWVGPGSQSTVQCISYDAAFNADVQR